jgi:hypothetical protein
MPAPAIGAVLIEGGGMSAGDGVVALAPEAGELSLPTGVPPGMRYPPHGVMAMQATAIEADCLSAILVQGNEIRFGQVTQ